MPSPVVKLHVVLSCDEIFNVNFSFSEISFAITTILNRRSTVKDSEFCVLNTPRKLRYGDSLSL